MATTKTTTTRSRDDTMSSCCIPPISVLIYITNGIDMSQTEKSKSISIADQEAFYDEILCNEQVNRDDQEAFYEEIIRIEQVSLKDNEHHTPRELFAMKRRKERQHGHEKLVTDRQKKNMNTIAKVLHNSRVQGILEYVRLRHRSLKIHKKKKKSNSKQQQMKMTSLSRGSTVNLEMEEEDNMFLHDISDRTH